MKKIPSLFLRDQASKLATGVITKGCEWVANGEGFATVKFDGTSCLVRSGKLYKRYDAKQGRTPPHGFEPCEPTPDAHTGHWPGWVPVGAGPEDAIHASIDAHGFADGTYELCGPKIQSNPESFPVHVLLPHGCTPCMPPINLSDVGKWRLELKRWLSCHCVEGIVWHHKDGRMCKIKQSDFGQKRPLGNIAKS